MVGSEEPTRRFRIIVDVLAVLTVIALVTSGFLFYDRINTSRQTQANTVAAIRTVLCFAQEQAETDTTITPAERERAIRFYTRALERIHALPCHPTTGGR